MGDLGDDFRTFKEFKQALKFKYGVPCPKCQSEQPKRQPTILLPGMWCKVHKPTYKDQRKPLTEAQKQSVY